MTSVLIVDDQELVRLGLRTLLESEDDLDVAGRRPTGWTRWRRPGGCAPTWC